MKYLPFFLFTVLFTSLLLQCSAQITPAVMEAAKKGNDKAQYQIAKSMCSCLFPDCSQEEAQERVYWLTLASNQGHPEAQTALGMMYFEGCGVPKDLTKYYSLQKKSAQGGSCFGMNNLAAAYLLGEGTSPDLDKAIYWIKKMKDADCDRWDLIVREFNLGEFID